MNYKLLQRVMAAIVFVISFIVLLSTVQPSVSFWDCGEFIAAGFYLQVPHPPGTPFFLMLGRFFSMLPIAENIGLRVNIISVITSALSILFLYLIAVKLIENYKGKKPENLLDAFGTYIAAAVGALSFSFSDTFWFNGVEAEVYAFSTFLFSFVTWLMMRWNERADQKDNEKYLLMIAYLIGLSTGVHLMSVLAIVPVVMVIVFRKYMQDEEALKKTAFIFLIHAALVLLIAIIMWAGEKSVSAPSPDQYREFDNRFKMIILGLSAIVMSASWKKIFNRNSFYTPLIIGGIALFLVYPGVVKYLPELLAAIAGNNIFIGTVLLIVVFTAFGYGVFYSVKEKKPTLHLIFMSFIFVLIGFTTFAMVIIRANENPPMNENEPNEFKELVSYLNRDQYGDFPTFKRRFSAEAHQQGIYTNYSSDLDFWWRYQMNHMMTRYWLWNYAGREGWQQDDGANIAPFNKLGNLFSGIINVRFNGDVADSLFGIPFLLGLLGIYFHFKKDWKMASVFLIGFIFMAYLTAFYQNQQEPQPRERDYFYVGAFFIFSIWIAIAVRSLIDLISNKINRVSFKNAAVVSVLILSVIFVPVRMLQANYVKHDRSKIWVPWDYSYNLLQSCAPNGVLFTNGDNDTFPLWYLQDVEGVRRDVKVVNLSLLNTDWYIKQLKNNDPYHVGKVKIRYTDAQIAQIRPIQWEPAKISIPTPKYSSKEELEKIITEYAIKDTSVLHDGKITFTMNNTVTYGNIKAIRVQDLMVKEIIEANNWERPIYFAVTVPDDSKIGLNNFLKMEGMATRLVPEKRNPSIEFLNEKVLSLQLKGNDSYSKEYKPGFKFRGLNDSTIFFDDNQRRMVQNYRNSFLRLAVYYINTKQNSLALEVLDNMEAKLPRNILGMDVGLKYELANIYHDAGGLKQADELYNEVEKIALKMLEQNPNDTQSYYNPYRMLLDIYESRNDYRNLLNLWKRIQKLYPSDPNVKENVDRYRTIVAAKDSILKANKK